MIEESRMLPEFLAQILGFTGLPFTEVEETGTSRGRGRIKHIF